MTPLITPATVVSALLFGSITAYFAFRRKKNPYLWFALGFFFGMVGLFAFFLFSKTKGKTPLSSKETKPQEAIPILPGPFDKFWYYLDASHQQIGPMSHQAISKAYNLGSISQTTYVWNEDMSDWKRIEELKT